MFLSAHLKQEAIKCLLNQPPRVDPELALTTGIRGTALPSARSPLALGTSSVSGGWEDDEKGTGGKQAGVIMGWVHLAMTVVGGPAHIRGFGGWPPADKEK